MEVSIVPATSKAVSDSILHHETKLTLPEGHEPGKGYPDFVIARTQPTAGERRHQLVCLVEIRLATTSRAEVTYYEERVLMWMEHAFSLPRRVADMKGFLVIGNEYKVFQLLPNGRVWIGREYVKLYTDNDPFTWDLVQIAVSCWN